MATETREQMTARLEDYADAWANEGMPYTVTALRAGAAALRAQGEDDADWWRQVAQGLGVEVARMKRLAKEATNGWACYATRRREHDEIARLHQEIDATAVDSPR